VPTDSERAVVTHSRGSSARGDERDFHAAIGLQAFD
jgi:hypothetical protein